MCEREEGETQIKQPFSSIFCSFAILDVFFKISSTLSFRIHLKNHSLTCILPDTYPINSQTRKDFTIQEILT